MEEGGDLVDSPVVRSAAHAADGPGRCLGDCREAGNPDQVSAATAYAGVTVLGEQAMDHIVTLDSRQEAELQAVADKFVRLHKGGVMRALKEMIVLNGHLQGELDKLQPARRGKRLI